MWAGWQNNGKSSALCACSRICLSAGLLRTEMLPITQYGVHIPSKLLLQRWYNGTVYIPPQEKNGSITVLSLREKVRSVSRNTHSATAISVTDAFGFQAMLFTAESNCSVFRQRPVHTSHNFTDLSLLPKTTMPLEVNWLDCEHTRSSSRVIWVRTISARIEKAVPRFAHEHITLWFFRARGYSNTRCVYHCAVKQQFTQPSESQRIFHQGPDKLNQKSRDITARVITNMAEATSLQPILEGTGDGELETHNLANCWARCPEGRLTGSEVKQPVISRGGHLSRNEQLLYLKRATVRSDPRLCTSPCLCGLGIPGGADKNCCYATRQHRARLRYTPTAMAAIVEAASAWRSKNPQVKKDRPIVFTGSTAIVNRLNCRYVVGTWTVWEVQYEPLHSTAYGNSSHQTKECHTVRTMASVVGNGWRSLGLGSLGIKSSGSTWTWRKTNRMTKSSAFMSSELWFKRSWRSLQLRYRQYRGLKNTLLSCISPSTLCCPQVNELAKWMRHVAAYSNQ